MNSLKRGFDHQQAGELSLQIDSYHDQFLEAEGVEKKIEALRLMKGCTAQYLYLVPHNRKFIFPETGRVLGNSVGVVDDFDPREASAAFEALAKYAHNLYEQPWRKEFHKIKLTSGFYIHNIRANLSNAQELLVQLNYASTDDTTLVLTSLPDTKRIKAFSRDCFIACQECVILSQIWERFQQQIPDYSFTVQDAFQARCALAGDLETILKSLLFDVQRRQHEHNLKMEEAKRQREEDELIRIRFMREEAKQKRQDEEMRELERQHMEEEKYSREKQALANVEKANRDAEARRQIDYGRNHVPTDRLIDFEDEKAPVSEEAEAVKQVLRNTERERSRTEYGSQFSDKSSKIASVHHHHHHQQPSSRNLTNGIEKGRNLKELQEVAFDYHLNQTSYSDNVDRTGVVDTSNRSVEENMRNFEEKSNKVEEIRNRRSNVQKSSVLQKDNEILSSGHTHSNFKSLKTKQDFPKVTTTSPSLDSTSSSSVGSWTSKPEKAYQLRNSYKEDSYKNGSGSNTVPEAERDFKKPKEQALMKMKVPVESKSPEFEFNSPNALGSFPSCEVARDTLNTSLYDDLTGLNRNEYEVIKNVTDKNLAFSHDDVKENKKSSKWICPHCTFLNKRPARICEACCKSSDFNLDSSSDSFPEENFKTQTYASVSRNDKSSKSKSISPVEEPVLKLSSRGSREMTPKDMKDYPPLEKSGILSANKFRAGFGSGDGDENCNSESDVRFDWECPECTFKNSQFVEKCIMCYDSLK